LRQRQSQKSQANLTPKQRTDQIDKNKVTKPGLQNIPANYFVPGTKNLGISGVGLLKPVPVFPQQFNPETNSLGKPVLQSKNLTKWVYFFIESNNQNVNVLEGLIKSFAIVRTLYPTTLKEVAFMLGSSYKNITGLTLQQYETGSFSHPSYINDDNLPFQIRYAEIPIFIQRTPGRLDNVPLGSPSFDTTPDGVTTRQGPIPTPPYTNFATSTGVTTSVFPAIGATVSFRDTSVRSPWQFAPTGWYWEFGNTASPTGSTAQNPIVLYPSGGSFTVTLTASNAAGSTTLTRPGFVNAGITTTSTTTTTTIRPITSTTTTTTIPISTSTTTSTTIAPTSTTTTTTAAPYCSRPSVIVTNEGEFTYTFLNNTAATMSLYDGPTFVDTLKVGVITDPITFKNDLITIIDNKSIGYFYSVEDGSYLGCGTVNITTTSTTSTSTSTSTSSTSTTSSSTTTTTTSASLSPEGPGGPMDPVDPELPTGP
jgi:PKD repeat protein